jgi:hypothetical protein
MVLGNKIDVDGGNSRVVSMDMSQMKAMQIT